MPEFITRCFFCGEEVDAFARSTLQHLDGWGTKSGLRSSGKQGGSDVRYRRYLDDYAHAECVERERNGVSANQGSLL